jgi:hypothetical protein
MTGADITLPSSAMPNEWERRYGKTRRAIDAKLLAACERQITAEEQAANRPAPIDDDARTAIARAFGRPLT